MICVYCQLDKPGRLLTLRKGWNQRLGSYWACYDCAPESSDMPPKKTVAPPATTDLLAIKRQGLPLLSIKSKVMAVRAPKTAEEFDQADAMLGVVSTTLKKWDALIEPVLGPLKRAEKELKSAMTGAKALNKEITDPLHEMEDMLRAGMKAFKVEEQRQIEAGARQRRELEHQLERQQEAALTAPRTPQRQRAEQAVASIEERIDALPEIPETSGLFSTVRTRRMWRIADPDAFYAGIVNGDIPKEAAPVSTVYMNQMFRDHGEGINAFPGVETFDDPIIAKRS